MKKYWVGFIIVLLLFSILSFVGCRSVAKPPEGEKPGDGDASISFTDIDTGNLNSQEIPAQNVTFSSAEDFKQFWDKYGRGSAPRIDFSKYMVGGVFLGSRPNPGYTVSIASIKKTDNKTTIHYAEGLPDPDRVYAAVIVYPHDMVYFEKVSGEIVFSSKKD